MATLLSNPNEVTIFAGNAKDIRYSCSEPLTLVVSVGQDVFSFGMDPIIGEVRVPLKQLLSALKVPSIGISERTHPITAVSISDSDEEDPADTVSLKVIPGRIGCTQEDVPDVLTTRFATWRPQVCKVCRWGADRMYAILGDDAHWPLPANLTVYARLRAYTDAGLLEDKEFQSVADAKGKIIRIPCDYATVESILQHETHDLDFGEITAYDISFYWIEGDIEHESAVQRFVLARSRSDWRQFIFRNSLGVFDALYSTGSFKDIPEYSIVQFTNNEVDSEIDNHVSRIFEVNTGRINDELERQMWLEFFGSDERYMVSPYDSTPRRIIVDEVECKHTLRQSNTATFRFHFAEPDAGRLVVREELPEWTDYGGRLMTADGDYFKTSDGDYIYFKRF